MLPHNCHEQGKKGERPSRPSSRGYHQAGEKTEQKDQNQAKKRVRKGHQRRRSAGGRRQTMKDPTVETHAKLRKAGSTDGKGEARRQQPIPDKATEVSTTVEARRPEVERIADKALGCDRYRDRYRTHVDGAEETQEIPRKTAGLPRAGVEADPRRKQTPRGWTQGQGYQRRKTQRPSWTRRQKLAGNATPPDYGGSNGNPGKRERKYSTWGDQGPSA